MTKKLSGLLSPTNEAVITTVDPAPDLVEAARWVPEPDEKKTETFEAWLSRQNLSLESGSLTQAQFSNQYRGWLEHLVQAYRLGSDTDGDGTIEVNLRQNDPTGLPSIEGLTAEQVDQLFSGTASIDVTTGKTEQERYYAGTFTWSKGLPPPIEVEIDSALLATPIVSADFM